MNIEEFNETIYKLYDIGLRKYSVLNSDQRHAFNYFDFIYSFENGGAIGFLYNTSPSHSGENLFQPYLDSWRFFGLGDLADNVEEYQNLYIKALRIYEEKIETDFKKIMQDVGLDKLEKRLKSEIEEVYRLNKISKWLEENVDKLKLVE
jgi:hypothetical protein